MIRSLLCSLVLSTLLPLTWAADRKTYPMDVPASGVHTIHFDVQEGEFILRGDPSATSISMQVSIDRYWIFRLGEEGILKRLIKVTGEGSGEVTIATDIPRSLANWGRAEYPIDFEVTVPAGIPLTVRDTSGDIRISQMNADVEIHDGSGRLTVSDVHAAVSLTKESGDIEVERISGVTRISSKTGQIKLQDLGGLEIEQSDGNLSIMNTGTARINNKGGNLRISAVKGPLEIQDESGEIQVANVAGAVNIHDTSGQIRVSQAEAVTVDDTDGDVTVRNAASLDVRTKESGQVKVSGISGAVEVPPNVTLKRE